MYYIGFGLGLIHGVLIGMLVYKYSYQKDLDNGRKPDTHQRAAVKSKRVKQRVS